MDRFCNSLREQTISLYSLILEYQIRLARQFSHSGVFRGIRDLAIADDWPGMVKEIESIDNSIHTMLAEWSYKTIQHIDEAISSLDEKLDKSLASLKIDLKVRFPLVYLPFSTMVDIPPRRSTMKSGSRISNLYQMQPMDLMTKTKQPALRIRR